MITGSVQENVKNLEIDVPKKTPATPRYLAKIIDIPIFNIASYTGTYLDLSNKDEDYSKYEFNENEI